MCRSLIFHIRIMCFIKMVTNAGAECTFPADLRGSWISADKGILTFTPRTLSGYNTQLTRDISSVDFDCNTLSSNQYYLRGNFLLNVFGSSIRPHICLEFYKVTSEKFYYYIGTDIETTINDRIYFAYDVNHVTLDDVCNRHKPFEVGTYVMLIKDGASDTSLSVICPSDISRNFKNVRFSASDGTHSCSGKLEAITDRLNMNYTYNSCDTRITFSVYGIWHCVYTIHSDNTTFLTTLNIDASRVSGQIYIMFCYTYRSEDKTLKATIYPGSCRPNQTDTYVSSPGVLVQMEISDVSDNALDMTTSSTSNTVKAGVAVGVPMGITGMICIIFAVVFIRRRSVHRNVVIENVEDRARTGETSRSQETGLYECTNVTDRSSYHTYDLLEPEELNCRFIDSNSQNENKESLTRNGEQSTIQENYCYESTHVVSRLSDHTYDPIESAEYYNMPNVSVTSAK